jgi:hypothetical protein
LASEDGADQFPPIYITADKSANWEISEISFIEKEI